MKVFLLCTQEMHPVPKTIKTKDFGLETVVLDGKGQATGVVLMAEGSIEDFRSWLGTDTPIWATTNPMVADWRLVCVDKENK